MQKVANLTSINDDGELAGLSCKQQQVLDLVLQHKSNKEIARILGISPSAVDQRLAGARVRLGTSRRSDTALAYAALRQTCVKTTGCFAQVDSQTQLDDRGGESELDALLVFEDVGMPNGFPTWPEPHQARFAIQDLAVPKSPLARIGLIIVFALLIMVVAMIGLSVSQGFVTLFG